LPDVDTESEHLNSINRRKNPLKLTKLLKPRLFALSNFENAVLCQNGVSESKKAPVLTQQRLLLG
jgi:hypothetical protein